MCLWCRGQKKGSDGVLEGVVVGGERGIVVVAVVDLRTLRCLRMGNSCFGGTKLCSCLCLGFGCRVIG